MEDSNEVHSEENRVSSENISNKTLKMPDSNEVHSKENKVSSEKNIKRTLKTPAQLSALEKFYNEHMYPTEELKSEVAKKIGLTEKQISSWFCHRRLKDKKLRDEPNGLQDRSGSIVPDRSSGLLQDSCGSTKQGEFRITDHREVDSPSLCRKDRAKLYSGNVSDPDDTSSDSSSSLQDKLLSHSEDPCGAETSRFMTQNGALMPLVNREGVDKIGYKPSGYLKVRGEIENAAITAVKKQLGRLYRDDGPPLGVEFEAPPPGAFASPTAELVHTPVYVGDLARFRSSNVYGVMKKPRLSSRDEVDISKMNSRGSYLEDSNHDMKYGCDSYGRKSDCQLEQVSTMDKFDELAGEASTYSHGRKRKMSSKHGNERKRSDSTFDHHGLNDWEVTNEERQAWSPDYNRGNPQKVKRKDNMSKPSSLRLGSDKSLHKKERLPDRRTTKMERVLAETKAKKEYHDPFRVNKQRVNEPTVKKKFGIKFEDEGNEYVGAASLLPYTQHGTRPMKSLIMERPSSFSEDETEETSNSED